MKQSHTPSRGARLFLGIALISGLAPFAIGEEKKERGDSNSTVTTRSPGQIPRPHRPKRPTVSPEDRPTSVRTIDGTNNNLANPNWGASDIPFLRIFEADYSDDNGAPSGADRPSAREVSNAVFAQEEGILNEIGATDYLWQWGQFLDHDITETPTVSPAEAFDISVPTGDPYFDPQSTGTQTIALNRSHYDPEVEGREQVNAITAFIDASNVYGADEERAQALRVNDGSGRLLVTQTEQGDLLPYNEELLDNAPAPSSNFFLAGDVRANEQIALTAMHTLFVREHNHWADRFAGENPDATDEEIYQMARRVVAAEMQAITYNEFLPTLLGRRALPRYRGYKEEVNPGIANSFATASYRFGHTCLSSTLRRVDADGSTAPEGDISLASAFFTPTEIETNGIDSILRGLAAQQCQELDAQVIDELRNFLFGPPGTGGFDLASLNIQRGRDHGLPSYNTVREELTGRAARDFRDITRDADSADRLEDAYDSVDDVDLWVGLLSEKHVRGAMVGKTLKALLTEQFVRLRDGDRFWYQNDPDRRFVRMIESQTLSKIIRRNTGIGEELPDNVFRVGDNDGLPHRGAPGGAGRGNRGGRPPRR